LLLGERTLCASEGLVLTTSFIRRALGWLGVDVALVFISLVAASYLRLGHGWRVSEVSLVSVLVAAFVYLISFYVADLNAAHLALSWRLLAFKTACTVIVGTGVIASLDYVDPRLRLGRGILGLLALNLAVGEVAARVGYSMVVAHLPPRRLLVVGNLKVCLQILKRLKGVRSNISVEGFLSDQFPNEAADAPALGGVADFREVAGRQGITDVVVGTMSGDPQFWRELVQARLSGIRVWSVPDFFQALVGQIPAEILTDGWLVFDGGFGSFEHPTTRRIKRLADIGGSLIVLLLGTPLMVLIGLVIKLTSAGPAFFRQVRIGMGDRPFELLKFRSMVAGHEHKSARWAADQDQRVTGVGRWLRRFHLDELPQVINVLRGEMSFVGPRPEQPELVEMLEARIPYYSLRHYVPPGITGWAQVNFGYANSIKSSQEKFCYDLFYVWNLSVALDLLILFWTLRVLLFGKSILRRPSEIWEAAGELGEMAPSPAPEVRSPVRPRGSAGSIAED
jgi:exopolysaccharide biosynthesis polyprenyl glycosylphosphotransferase